MPGEGTIIAHAASPPRHSETRVGAAVSFVMLLLLVGAPLSPFSADTAKAATVLFAEEFDDEALMGWAASGAVSARDCQHAVDTGKRSLNTSAQLTRQSATVTRDAKVDFTPPSGPSDWPTLSATNARNAAWAAVEPATPWGLDIGKNWFTVEPYAAVIGNNALVVSRDTIWSVDSQNGQPRWTVDLPTVTEATPAVVGSRLIYASNAGQVGAIDIGSGESIWKHHLNAYITSSPVVQGTRAFVASWNSTVAFDLESGKILWEQPRTQDVMSPLSISGGRLFTTSNDGTVIALDARTGAEIWRTWLTDLSLKTGALTLGDRIFVALSYKAWMLDAATGEILWQKSLRWGTSTASSSAGDDIVVSTHSGIIALDPATGDTRWATPTHQLLVPSAIVDDRIYAGATSGQFYVLDASTGQVISQWSAGGVVLSSPIIVGDYAILSLGRYVILSERHTLQARLLDGSKFVDAVEPGLAAVAAALAALAMVGGRRRRAA